MYQPTNAAFAATGEPHPAKAPNKSKTMRIRLDTIAALHSTLRAESSYAIARLETRGASATCLPVAAHRIV